MILHTVPAGRVSVVVLDQHRAIHAHDAATCEELWEWLLKQDPDAEPGEAFCLNSAEWAQVVRALDLHGWVRVETEFDCDLVVTRHHR